MKIALIIGGISFDSQRQLASGIAETAEVYGDCVVSYDSSGKLYLDQLFSEDDISDFRVLELVDVSRFDGVIIAQNTIVNKAALDYILNQVETAKVPVVCVDAKEAKYASIETDHQKSMQLITDHLIEKHNARKLCFFAGPAENRDSILRLQGFRDSLIEHFGTDEGMTLVYGNYNAMDAERKTIEYMERESILPDAFVCANDDMAVGVCCALRDHGIRVPEDIIVTGFDGALSAQYFSPQITTGQRKQREIGQTAVHMLHKGLDQYPQYQSIIADLWIMRSCGCNPQQELNYNELLYTYQKKLINQSEKNMYVLVQQQNIVKAETYKELKSILLRYVRCIGPKKCYICLCERSLDVSMSMDYIDISRDLNANMASYSEKMSLFVGYDSQKDEVIRSNELFDPRDLLPQEIMSTLEGECLHVFSLQLKSKCFGYVVLSNEDVVEQYDLYYSWVTQIAIALEILNQKQMLHKVVDRLNVLWGYDSLTGLYNRTGFHHEAKYLIQECMNRQERLTILFLDMDDLKMINDTYGHEEGDFAICSLARVLKKLRRAGDLMVRFGGDEFVVLTTIQTENGINRYINSIQEELRQIERIAGKPYHLSASAGFTTEMFHSTDELDEFIKMADSNMYVTKKANKEQKGFPN